MKGEKGHLDAKRKGKRKTRSTVFFPGDGRSDVQHGCLFFNCIIHCSINLSQWQRQGLHVRGPRNLCKCLVHLNNDLNYIFFTIFYIRRGPRRGNLGEIGGPKAPPIAMTESFHFMIIGVF